MLFLTKRFGVTSSDAERDLTTEAAHIEEIVQSVLLMQANAAVRQQCPLARGTHAKGICARARFEVFDLRNGRDAPLAGRLARGIFAKPGNYPATVRFANSDPQVNSDFKADVRSLSISVDLTCDGTKKSSVGVQRQDFSLQNATTLPLNDARAFVATMRVLTASSPVKSLWSLPIQDKLRVVRTLTLARSQARQPVRPYQQLRYWSTVPFRHGPEDVVKQSAIPSPDNPSHPLQRGSPNALTDELVRHLGDDSTPSGFDFGLQFLDTGRMTYWGKRQDANFWIENASVEWPEAQSSFHMVGRLTLMPRSQFPPDAGEAAYFDVTRNAAPDSAPIGSINRARWPAEAASRRARLHADPESLTQQSLSRRVAE